MARLYGRTLHRSDGIGIKNRAIIIAVADHRHQPTGSRMQATPSILVTGASGFIGRALCSELRAQNKHIRAGMRQPTVGPWDEAVIFDLSTDAIPEEILTGIDTVFHLAGKAHALAETQQDEHQYFHINTEGTRKLLSAGKKAGVKHFIFVSSVKAMDEGGAKMSDETDECHPITPYGKSKLAAERLVLKGDYVPAPVVLRLTMVYGGTQKGNLPRMIEAIAKGRFPPLPEFRNRRSMVHVDDVVQALLLASERQSAIGQTYIVTDGNPVSTRNLFEWISETLEKPLPRWTTPLSLLKALAFFGDGIGHLRGRRFVFDSDALTKLTESSCYSSKKIEQELGFKPHRGLRSSLAEIVTYLKLK